MQTSQTGMTATVIFDLPEEYKAHLRCAKSLDMAIVLFEIQNNLWRQFKHREEDPTLFYEFREAINSLLHDYGIIIEDLIE